MIGTLRVRSRPRIRAAVSRPLMIGMRTSIRMTAASSLSRNLSASLPEDALTMLRSGACSIVSSDNRLARLSSTSRMLIFPFPFFIASPKDYAGIASTIILYGGCYVPIEPDAQHRKELIHVDRLGDVIGGSGFEALVAIGLHRLGSQSDDREILEPLDPPYGMHRLVPVHLRHHDVHQHHTHVRILVKRLYARAPVLGAQNIYVVGFERAGQGEDVAQVVVHDQNLAPFERRIAAQ